MKGQRFQEILVELERCNFPEILEVTRKCFQQEHKEEEILAYFDITLFHNWYHETEYYQLEAEDVMPTLRNLSEESVFCLDSIYITPVVVYVDASGKEKKYHLRAATQVTGCGMVDVYISFDGDTQPHWQELRYQVDGDKEQVAFRKDLVTGMTLAQTAAGPLKVFSVSLGSLILMLGNNFAHLSENKEYLWDCLPGVKAGIYYDHEEFPALWSWLHIDDETEGEDTPWYLKRHEQKDDIYEGMDYIEKDPNVKIVKISSRSITLSVSSGLQGSFRPREIVLDQPNHEVVIWKKGPRSLKAMLYVTSPSSRKSGYFEFSDPVPVGCVAEVSITGKGEEKPSYTTTVDIRTIPHILRSDDYKYESGTYWTWLEVWGFVNGKMAVGTHNPHYHSGSCHFVGLLEPGKQYVFPINDDDGYKENVHHGQISISWKIVETGLEIQDGVLKSIPDVKEFVVPEEVREMHYQCLLSAPSLRKITLRPGVDRFSYALDEFHGERGVKLDVVFDGSVQDWFNSAVGLANHIGRLIIQGKEYDFYDTDDVVIPEGVSRIGNDFFSRSKVLRSLVLPPSVVKVGDHAFAYCDRLRTVKVEGPAHIGSSAFVSCHDLCDIDLGDSVVFLGYGCFDFLTKVKSIFIPKSVKELGGVLSSQNDGSCIAPVFLCEAPSRPSGWTDGWNLSYYDPRFGRGNGHDHFHPVQWGCKRLP